MDTQEQANKNKKIKRLIWIGAGIAVVGTAGYFGYQHFFGRNGMKEGSDLPDNEVQDLTRPDTITNPSPPPTKPKANDGFPLKKGSKGDKVKQLQQALISKFGAGALPKYGADGDFGSEVISVLTKNGLPTEIDESTFNVLAKSSSVDPSQAASVLYMAANSKNFDAAIKGLKNLKSVEDYKAAGDIFKIKYLINGVHQTLVNGLLSTFSEPSQKDKIKMEFLRMGLKYNGAQWSLSGNMKQIITKVATKVWAGANESVPVAAGIVLGIELASRNGYTAFQTVNDKRLIVKTNTVKYFN
jgi:hypothetical protein